EKLKEENYFFKLSAYRDRLLKLIESDELRIIPITKRNEILALLKEGLDDVSISRPADKISWGIPVPGDENHVMYVWFEALMNYITVLGYPENEDYKAFWPAQVQVIGKDILRFHAAIWPAMLMGLGAALPKTLYVHSFININGQKMSKSLGNYVAPGEVIDKYGTDAFRYYFLRHIPSYNDGDFSWETFEATYNNELANELGNAVQRTIAMIHQYLDDMVGELPEAQHDIAQYQEALDACRFDRALDEVWELVRGLNQYIDQEKPWVLAKDKDPAHLREVLAYQASSLVFIADLLEPFLPDTAAKIKTAFGGATVKPIAGTLFPKHAVTEAPTGKHGTD
ncbi:MAG TPA: class I tRNA ligase family protein, partial [Verrucomicrobiae bacterium]|nr:class I tRNA ligase family protein [Verrucomicrobiae bacterium]